jgi:hypothetical protein
MTVMALRSLDLPTVIPGRWRGSIQHPSALRPVSSSRVCIGGKWLVVQSASEQRLGRHRTEPPVQPNSVRRAV